MKSAGTGSEFTESVRLEHREPDIAIFIKGKKERLAIAGRELIRSDPARCGRVKYLDLARRCTTGTVRGGIASWDGYPDIALAIESCAPQVHTAWNVPVLSVNLRRTLSEN